MRRHETLQQAHGPKCGVVPPTSQTGRKREKILQKSKFWERSLDVITNNFAPHQNSWTDERDCEILGRKPECRIRKFQISIGMSQVLRESPLRALVWKLVQEDTSPEPSCSLLFPSSYSSFPLDTSSKCSPGVREAVDDAWRIHERIGELAANSEMRAGKICEAIRRISIDPLLFDLTSNNLASTSLLDQERVVLKKHASRLRAVRIAIAESNRKEPRGFPCHSVVLAARVSKEHQDALFELYEPCVRRWALGIDELLESAKPDLDTVETLCASMSQENALTFARILDVLATTESLDQDENKITLTQLVNQGFNQRESIEWFETRTSAWLQQTLIRLTSVRTKKAKSEALLALGSFPNFNSFNAVLLENKHSATQLLAARGLLNDLSETRKRMERDWMDKCRGARRRAGEETFKKSNRKEWMDARERLVFVTALERFCVTATDSAKSQLFSLLDKAESPDQVSSACGSFEKTLKSTTCFDVASSSRGVVVRLLSLSRKSLDQESDSKEDRETISKSFKEMARFLSKTADSRLKEHLEVHHQWSWAAS